MLLWAAKSAQCCTQVKRIFQVRRRERVRCTSVRRRCDVDVDVGSSCCDNFFNCTFAPHTSFTLCVVAVVILAYFFFAYFSLSSIVCTHTSIKSKKHTHANVKLKLKLSICAICGVFSFSLALLFFFLFYFTLLFTHDAHSCTEYQKRPLAAQHMLGFGCSCCCWSKHMFD